MQLLHSLDIIRQISGVLLTVYEVFGTYEFLN